MYSLFEEQLRQRSLRRPELLDEPADSFGEALSYFPATTYEDPGPRDYLSLLERAGSCGRVRPTDAGRRRCSHRAEHVRRTRRPPISGTQLEQRHIEVLHGSRTPSRFRSRSN